MILDKFFWKYEEKEKTTLKKPSLIRVKMPKKYETVKLKSYKEKMKSLFVIYSIYVILYNLFLSESILVSEKNGKPNPDEPDTNKYASYFGLSLV